MADVASLSVSESRPRSNLRWLLVVQLYIAAFLSGVANALTEHGAIHFLLALIMASTAVWWATKDARAQRCPILHVVQMFMFFLWPIALPIYLTWSRGWRGIGWALLHSIGLLAVVGLGAFVAMVTLDGNLIITNLR